MPKKKSRGRPALANPRTQEIRVRVNTIELAQLTRAAAALGMPVSVYMRYAALVAQLPSAHQPPAVDG